MLYIIIIIIHYHAQLNVRREIVTKYSFKDTYGRTAQPDMTVSAPIKKRKKENEEDVIPDTHAPKTKV